MATNKELSKMSVDELAVRKQSIFIVFCIMHIIGCAFTIASVFLFLTEHFVVSILFIFGAGWAVFILHLLHSMRDEVVNQLQILGKYKK